MDVNLQFTQEDRDLLMRLEGKLDHVASQFTAHNHRLASHHKRIKTLESVRDEQRGLMRALGWAWGVIVALAGLFGWHLSTGGGHTSAVR